MNKWLATLRAEMIRVTTHITVIYFEWTELFSDVPPLKNRLQPICAVLKQHNRGMKVFVANLLPRIPNSPMRNHLESDFILVQAVRSINRALKKVHLLSLYEHFTSSKGGRVIQPTQKYFQESGQLTRLGCLTFWECMLREVGVKPYWFD